MNIAESSARFPITVIVRVLLVIVFGYGCWTFLVVELKPETEQPVLVVSTRFPGAAPEEVEGEVTNCFEEYIADVSNVLYTLSFSPFGQSFVVAFKKITNREDACPECANRGGCAAGLSRAE
jgi:hydrophobic/amphiphilic exporter-1 (mainly G- bacteria), HAE1 family